MRMNKTFGSREYKPNEYQDLSLPLELEQDVIRIPFSTLDSTVYSLLYILWIIGYGYAPLAF